MISPTEVIRTITEHVPQPVAAVPAEPLPDFEMVGELARIVTANPSRLLDAAVALGNHREQIAFATQAAAELVSQAVAELVGIGQRYLSEAGALLPLALTPGAFVPVAAHMAELGARALTEIEARLSALEADLRPHTLTLLDVAASAGAEPSLAPSPAAQQATDELHTLAASAHAPTSAPDAVGMEPASAVEEAVVPPGSDEAGSAAGRAAVEAAKSQLGAPYMWGGTGPGGFDCSGLTSWAYRQAGVELPRMAHEQAVGTQVSFEDLQPGDLAVWDGHVAMYAGDGMYIEAGDPVQMNPVRTNNIGMAFKGFWRPTA